MTDLTNTNGSYEQIAHVTNAPSYIFLGVRMDIHLSGEQTGGGFSLMEAFMPPGGDGGLHMHTEEDETLHVISGKLDVTIGDQQFVLGPGETSFGPRNIPHRIQNNGTEVARVILVNTPGTFDAFVKKAGIPAHVAAANPVLPPPTPEQIMQLIQLADEHGIKVLGNPGE